jgi:hypothetical protein
MEGGDDGGSNKKMLLIGGAAIVVVVGAIAIGWYMYSDSKSPEESVLADFRLNGVPNSNGNYKLDVDKKYVTLVLGPMSVDVPAKGAGVQSVVIPDSIMPNRNIAAAYDRNSGVIGHPAIASDSGVVVLRLYPSPGGNTRLVFHFSSNNADGTHNSTHFQNIPEGKFEILKPITIPWSYAPQA